MAQIKIYPATQAQAQDIQDTVDEINAKITTPTYQAKIVTPTTAQQLVEPDNGYDALSSVTVNAVTAIIDPNIKSENIANNKTILGVTGTNGIDLEKFILNTGAESYTIVLHGAIPQYACYGKSNLRSVDFSNVTHIYGYAFYSCGLEEVIIKSTVDIPSGNNQGSNFANCVSLRTADVRGILKIPSMFMQWCSSLVAVDARSVMRIDAYAFRYSNVNIFDLTSISEPPTLVSTNAFDGTQCYFVFDNDTIKNATMAATNWSAFAANRFKTTAEIEALVGMTYDEYYLQVFGHARNEVSA